MQITVAVNDPSSADEDDFIFLQVSSETTVANLKSMIAFERNIAVARQRIFYHNAILNDANRTMQDYQISNDSMLAMQVISAQPVARQGGPAQPQPRQRAQGARDYGDLERLRLQYLSSLANLAQLRLQAPDLANTVQDPVQWRDTFLRLQGEIDARKADKEREIELLNADPFDVEAQTRMEEIIRLERVEENFQQTQEYHPETFGRVHMLYIDVEVNGNKVKAFVDSGAQATIMSPDCAEKCGIMRLLDRRFAGLARGVGTANILGKVHSAPIKIGSSFLPCAFTVMEGKDVDLLLGLDMLKRYQACIDLRRGVLMIQGEEVAFLGEADIPKNSLEEEPTVDGPSGTKIGGISGAVTQSDTSKAPGSTPTQAGPSGAQQPLSATGPTSFPPEAIAKITDLGFSREEAMQALAISGGDVDAAVGMLL